jgi:hypothetical protein
MTLPIEGLSQRSSPDQVKEAIAASMQQCMAGGEKSQEQCQSEIMALVKRKMGNTIRRGMEE